MKTVKISELPTSQSREGLYTIGTDGNNRSVKVPLDSMAMLNGDTGRLNYSDAPATVLASMGQELDSVGKTNPVAHVAKANEYIWDPTSGNILYYKTAENYESLGAPQRGIVYTNAHSNRQYRWLGNAWQQVGDNALSAEQVKILKELIDNLPLGAEVVDNLETAERNKALSGRQGMLLRNNIEVLFDKVNDLYDRLAGIAFLQAKPDASWRAYPDWSVPVVTHRISLGTVSNVAVYLGEDLLEQDMQVPEGEVTLKLIPAQGMAVMADSISVMCGNTQVHIEVSTEDGITMITFELTGDVQVSAEASSGVAVQVVGQNVQTNVQSIPLEGNGRSIVLSHPDHYHWDGDIALSVGNVALVKDTDYTLASSLDGTKTIYILKTFTSDDDPIVINANAVENGFVTMKLSGVGDHVLVTVNGQAVNEDDHYYNSENDLAIVIAADDGYRLAGSPTIKLVGDTTEQVNTTTTKTVGAEVDSGTVVVIIAEAVEIPQRFISWNSGNYRLQDANGDEITSPTSVLDGDDFEAWLVPGASAVIDSVSCNVDGMSYDAYSGHLAISNITADVVLSIEATSDDDYMYKGVWYEDDNAGGGYLHVGENENTLISPLFDLGDNRTEDVNITFSTDGTANTKLGLVHFDANKKFIKCSRHTSAAEETVAVDAQTRYICLMTGATDNALLSSFIRNADTNVTLWDGSTCQLDDARDSQQFEYSPRNENHRNDAGDAVGWLYIAANKSAIGYSIQGSANAYTGNSVRQSVWSIFSAIGNRSQVPYVVGKPFDIAIKGVAQQTTYYAGGAKDSAKTVPCCLLMPVRAYFTFEATDKNDDKTSISTTGYRRTKTWDAQYAQAVMVVEIDKYNSGNVFVRRTATSELLWGFDIE